MAESLGIEIGRRVRDRRESLGMTREHLAEKSELSVQFLAEIESGRKNMTTKSLYKVARALNLSADYIVFGEQAGADRTRFEEMLAELSKEDRDLAEDILKSFIKAVKNKR